MILAMWVAVFAVLVVGFLLLRRRTRLQRRYVSTRTEEHQAKVELIREWLSDERIVRAIVQGDRHGGSPDASPFLVEMVYQDIGSMSEAGVNQTLGLLLTRRVTRLAIASYMERAHNLNPYKCRRALLEWSGKMPVAEC